MRKLACSLVASVLTVGILAGCNTMEGLGKDIMKGGEAIKRAADNARK